MGRGGGGTRLDTVQSLLQEVLSEGQLSHQFCHLLHLALHLPVPLLSLHMFTPHLFVPGGFPSCTSVGSGGGIMPAKVEFGGIESTNLFESCLIHHTLRIPRDQKSDVLNASSPLPHHMQSNADIKLTSAVQDSWLEMRSVHLRAYIAAQLVKTTIRQTWMLQQEVHLGCVCLYAAFASPMPSCFSYGRRCHVGSECHKTGQQ